MLTSLICCCLCFRIVGSIVMVARIALMRTVAVISKRERKKSLLMFVRLSSPLYTHAYTHTRLPFLLPTPMLHSYVTEKKKTRREKKKKKGKKTDGKIKRRRSRAHIRSRCRIRPFCSLSRALLWRCVGCHGHQEHRRCSPFLASSSAGSNSSRNSKSSNSN